MLELSCIPALIHDSDLLKPVGDFPVSGIAKQYLKNKKQVFIAIDKIEKYHEDAKKIFEDTQVIRLSANGGELFGKAWNKI